MTEGKTMTSFQVPTHLLDEVRQLAITNDRSVSAELRRALVEHVERQQTTDSSSREPPRR
jgi:predicted transcriptional regulator